MDKIEITRTPPTTSTGIASKRAVKSKPASSPTTRDKCCKQPYCSTMRQARNNISPMPNCSQRLAIIISSKTSYPTRRESNSAFSKTKSLVQCDHGPADSSNLNKVENNGTYMIAIRKSVDHAWKYTRDAETGLFFKQFSGNDITDNPGDILAQGAMVELFAKLAVN